MHCVNKNVATLSINTTEKGKDIKFCPEGLWGKKATLKSIATIKSVYVRVVVTEWG